MIGYQRYPSDSDFVTALQGAIRDGRPVQLERSINSMQKYVFRGV